MTDFNVLFLRPSMIGATDGVDFLDLMSSGCLMVSIVSDLDTMWSMAEKEGKPKEAECERPYHFVGYEHAGDWTSQSH